jgi:hypothetical protein
LARDFASEWRQRRACYTFALFLLKSRKEWLSLFAD